MFLKKQQSSERNKNQKVLNIKKPLAETNGSCILAPIAAASPDLEKQGFFSRSFYLSGIQRIAGLAPEKYQDYFKCE